MKTISFGGKEFLSLERIAIHDCEESRINSEIRIASEFKCISFEYEDMRIVMHFGSVQDISGFVRDLADKVAGIEMMAAFDVLDTMEGK